MHRVAGVTVTTLAGGANPGTSNGTGTAAKFSNPVNILLDETGELVIADYDSDRLRISTATGTVTTLTNQGDFKHPFGLIWSGDGKLFAQTDYNETGQSAGPAAGVIWQINLSTGAATAKAVGAGRPRGMTTLSNGQIMVSDIERHDIRILNPTSGELTSVAGASGCRGFADGSGGQAKFDAPYGMVTLSNGDVLVADLMNHRIRKVTADGKVSTYAGDGTPGLIDGARENARFDQPKDLALDAAGNVYVSDTGNHVIRVIRASGEVETVAGSGASGFDDGDGDEASFYGQEGIDVTPNGKVLYVADGTGGEIEPVPPYHRVRKVSMP
ncbi:MAG: hypothetical protein HOW73_23815 [Polyangiaceae bacterium]|nr:hypothetical protein [Polyangiaceae bacterium]